MLEAFVKGVLFLEQTPKVRLRVGLPTPCTLDSSQKPFWNVGSKEGGWWSLGFGFSCPTVTALLRLFNREQQP